MPYNLLRGCYSVILMSMLLTGVTGVTSESKAHNTGLVHNHPPTMTGYLGNRNIAVGETLIIDLSRYFDDEDGGDGNLTYSRNAFSSNLVTVTIDNETDSLTIVADDELTGMTDRIVITATDTGGLSAAQDFTITVTAVSTPDPLNISVSHSTVSEGDTVSVTVTAFPGGNSVYDVEQEITVDVAGSGGVGYAPIDDFTFTLPAGQSSSSETFTLSTIEDRIDRSNTTVTVSAEADPSGGSMSKTITITDDDKRGIGVSPSSVMMGENGGTDTYVVWLATEPDGGNVTVSVKSGDTTDATVTPDSIEFTSNNWGNPITVTVTGKDDSIDNENNTRTPQITNLGSGADYGGQEAIVNVTVTDDDPEITISVSQDEVSEGDGVTITVVASTEPINDLSVGLSKSGATEVVDGQIPDRIVIDAGTTRKSVPISMKQNDVHEPDKSFIISLKKNDYYRFGVPSSVSVTVLNDDELHVALEVSPTRVDEGVTSEVTATLNRVSTADTRVTVDAVPGAYSVVGSGTVTISAGQTSGTVTIRAADNSSHESDRTVTVDGSATNPHGVSGFTGASLTIENDDLLNVALEVSPTRVDEGVTSEVTATLNRVSTADTRVTVDAVPGAYSVVGSGTVTISAGQTSGTVTIRAADNSSHESDRTVTVDGSATNPHGVSGFTGASLTIENDDLLNVTLEVSPTRVDEGVTSEVTATLNRVSTADTRVTVDAVPGAYSVVGSGTVTISAGQTSGTVTIRAADNSSHESDRTVTVDGSATNPHGVSGFTGASLTIENDDLLNVALEVSPTRVDEGVTSEVTATLNRVSTADTRVTVDAVPGAYSVVGSGTVTISAGQTSGTVTIRAADNSSHESDRTVTVDGSATNPHGVSGFTGASLTIENDDLLNVTLEVSPTRVDEGVTSEVTATLNRVSTADTRVTVDAVPGAYSVVGSGTVTISAGQTSGTVTIRAADNSSHESDRTVTVDGSATNPHGVSGFTGASLTIENDDLLNVALEVSPTRVDEGVTSEVTATLNRVSTADTRVTVDAVPGAYSVVGSGTVTISAGQTSGTVTIRAADNSSHESDRTVTVDGSATNPHGVSGFTGASLTIENDDLLNVTLEVSPTRVDEGVTSEVTATLNRVSTADTRVTVDAVPGAYSVVGSGTVTISAGQTSGTVTIRAADNSSHESDRTVTVDGSATNPHGVSGFTGASLTIENDDLLNVTLEVSPTRVDEGVTSEVTATLNRVSTADTRVTVDAVPGAYSVVGSGTVTISAGQTSGTVTIRAADNSSHESDRTVTVDGSATNPHGVSGFTGASLTIENDDLLNVTLEVSPTRVDEGVTSEVTATLNRVSTADTRVTVDAVPGAYSVVGSGTVTISAGQTSGTVTIRAADDALDGPDREVTVTAKATNAYGIEQPNGVALTIRDNDVPSVTISAGTSPIVEGGEAVFTLLVSPVSAFDFSVDVVVSGAPDFLTGMVPRTESVSINADSSSAKLRLSTEDDGVHEISASVTATVSTGDGYEVGFVKEAVIEINDNDTAPMGITLTVSPSLHSEDAGVTTVTVTASLAGGASIQNPQIVTVTVSGSGTAGAVEFEQVSSFVVTIPAGMASGDTTFTLTPLDNALDNVDETITLSGQAFPSNLTVTPASITLTDDDDLTVTIEAVTGSVTEGSSAAFTVSSSPTPAVDLSVEIAIDGAEGFISGTVPGSRTVTIEAESSTGELRLETIDDNVHEVSDTLTATLNPIEAYEVGSNSEAQVVINDNDTSPTGISLSVSNSSILEDADTTEVTVTATLGGENTLSTDQTVAVSFSTSGMSGAVAFELLTNFQVVISAGNSSGDATFTLTPMDNALDNLDEVITLSGTASPSGLAVTSTTITLTDDDVPAVTISAVVDTVTEGTAAAFNLTASPVPAVDLSVIVNVSGADSFLINAVDTVEVQIPAGMSQGTLSLVTDDDSIDDVDASLTATVLGGNGYEVGNPGSVSVTVKDDDPAQTGIVLSVSTPAVAENAEATEVTVTATLSDENTLSTDQTVAVSFSTSGMSGAVAFELLPNFQVVISAGNSSGDATFTLTPMDNALDNLDEVITLSGTASPSGLAVTSTTITLTDDDVPAVTISAVVDTVTEGTAAAFNLTASPVPAVDLSVIVNVSGADSFLINAVDTVEVQIPAGMSQGMLSLVTDDDSNDEADATLTVMVLAGTGYEAGATSKAEVHIRDNDEMPLTDPTGITISVSPNTWSEGGGNTTVTVTATPLGGTFADEQILTVSVAGSSIPNTVGFTAVTAFTVPITSGSTSGTGSFSLAPLNNSVVNVDETITVSGIVSPSGLQVTSATLKLTDDEVTTVAPQYKPGNVMVTRGDGELDLSWWPVAGATSYKVRFREKGGAIPSPWPPQADTNGSTSYALMGLENFTSYHVRISASNSFGEGPVAKVVGTPRPPDLPPAPGNFVVTPGDGKLTLSWSTVTDAAGYDVQHRVKNEAIPDPWPWTDVGTSTSHTIMNLENDTIYIVRVRARNASGYGGLVAREQGTPSTQPLITVFSVTSPITEGMAADFTVTAMPAPAESLTVNISLTGGEGFVTGTLPTSVTIPSGLTTASVSVDTEDDKIDEDLATVTASVVAGSGYRLGSDASAQVDIDDNDDAPIGIKLTVTPIEVLEDAGLTSVTVTAAPTGGTFFGSPQVVTVTITDTGTTNGVTYTAVNTMQVTISAGATSGSNTFNLTPNDNTSDNTVEVLTLTGSVMPSATTVTPAWIVLIDDDGSEIAVSAGPSPVSEGGTITFTITATPAPVVALPVNVTIGGGESFLTGDIPTSVTIEASQTTGTITLNTEDDAVDEPGGAVTLTANHGNGYYIGTSASAQVSVTDNDDPPTGIALSVLPTTVSEADSSVAVKVKATPTGGTRFGEEQSVSVSVAGSGEANAVGFAAVAGFEVVIPAGAAEGESTFTLVPVDNLSIDADETIQVSGSVSSQPALTVTSASLTLTDDDAPVITITAMADSVTEGTSARFALSVSPAPNVELSVNLSISDGGDYLSTTATDTTVTIGAGVTSVSLDLGTDNDDMDEAHAAVKVTVTAGSGYEVGEHGNARVVIKDNDQPTGPPSEPGNVRVTTGDRKATLNWSAATRATWYEVQYRVMGEQPPDPWPWTNVGNVTSYTFEGLVNGTRYKLRLRAMNESDSSTVVKRDATPVGTSTRKLARAALAAAPSVVNAPDDIMLAADETRTLDVAATFTGHGLTYSASATDETVLSASLADGELTLTGLARGSTTLSVTAHNDAGSAGYTLSVTVTASMAEHVAYESVLAAVGRSLLSSARVTMEDRFSAASDQRRLSLAGRRVDGVATGVSALIGLAGYHIPQHWNDPISPRSTGRVDVLRNSSFSYTLAGDEKTQGAGRVTLWGTGNVQAYRSSLSDLRYDGDLRTGYAGVDVSIPGLVAGMAVSRTMGAAGYQAQGSQGEMTTRLTGVYPYARWQSASRPMEVWSILGTGRGETVAGGESRDLSMRMAMMGLRAQWINFSGLGLSVVGHAGVMSLSSPSSAVSTLGGLDASMRQVRLGLEGSARAFSIGGSQLTPFAQVAGRYDGGTGENGSGLEVAGGLRLAAGRLGVEARGRMLAAHTASGYHERGLSLIAFIRPQTGSGGLTVSVAPSWGDDTRAVDMTWRQDTAIARTQRSQDHAGAVRAQIGYSMLYPSLKDLVVTPFGEADMTTSERRTVRLGTRMGSREGMMSLELAGERSQDRSGDDHRIGLLARMRF